MFGRLVLGRAAEEVALELVGPRSARELSAIVSKLLELGADMVLVDGALDRMAAASPKVTDAVILATGASLDMDLEAAAQEMGFLVWLSSPSTLWTPPPLPGKPLKATRYVSSMPARYRTKGYAATHDICSENHRCPTVGIKIHLEQAGDAAQLWCREVSQAFGQGLCLGERRSLQS